MQETQETKVRSPGQKDPLEEGTATHAFILVWRISWTEEPGGLQSMELQRIGYGVGLGLGIMKDHKPGLVVWRR